MTPEQAELKELGFEVPDSITPIVACRSWRITCHGKLGSHNGTPWTPGKAMKAKCSIGGHHHADLIAHFGLKEGKDLASSDIPMRLCTCGFYAAKHEEADYIVPTLPHYIHGEVYMWGKIVEGPNGYRSEFMYPKRFFAINEEQRVLLEGMGFGVPVILVKGTYFRFPFPKGEAPTARAKERSDTSVPFPLLQFLSALPALVVAIVDAFTLDMSRAFNQILVALMLSVGAVAASLSIYLFLLRKKMEKMQRVMGVAVRVNGGPIKIIPGHHRLRTKGRQRR